MFLRYFWHIPGTVLLKLIALMSLRCMIQEKIGGKQATCAICLQWCRGGGINPLEMTSQSTAAPPLQEARHRAAYGINHRMQVCPQASASRPPDTWRSTRIFVDLSKCPRRAITPDHPARDPTPRWSSPGTRRREWDWLWVGCSSLSAVNVWIAAGDEREGRMSLLSSQHAAVASPAMSWLATWSPLSCLF